MSNEEVIRLYCAPHDYRDIHGEHYQVGENGVLRIEEHRAMGEGDKWYYDVIHAEGFTREFWPAAADVRYVNPPTRCPNCGREWDMTKHNACECGATLGPNL